MCAPSAKLCIASFPMDLVSGAFGLRAATDPERLVVSEVEPSEGERAVQRSAVCLGGANKRPREPESGGNEAAATNSVAEFIAWCYNLCKKDTCMSKLRVAVIGVGHLGSIHARIYSEMKNIELVGVCDIDIRKARKVARACKTKAYASYKDLIGQIDAASVVVPTNLHYQVSKDLLLNGINLLIEKPMTKTLEEADELLEIAEKRNLILQVGHVERFNAAIRAIEHLAHKPRFIEVHRLGPFPNRSTDIGVVMDLMIHDIDIILGFVKSKVARVEAVGLKVLTNYEDIANARIVFEDKTVADVTASRLTPNAMRKIRIFVEDAYISLDYLKQDALIYTKQNNKIVYKRVNIKKEQPLQKELQAFADCVNTKEKPLVSGKEAREALKVALDIIEDIKKNA